MRGERTGEDSKAVGGGAACHTYEFSSVWWRNVREAPPLRTVRRTTLQVLTERSRRSPGVRPESAKQAQPPSHPLGATSAKARASRSRRLGMQQRGRGRWGRMLQCFSDAPPAPKGSQRPLLRDRRRACLPPARTGAELQKLVVILLSGLELRRGGGQLEHWNLVPTGGSEGGGADRNPCNRRAGRAQSFNGTAPIIAVVRVRGFPLGQVDAAKVAGES